MQTFKNFFKLTKRTGKNYAKNVEESAAIINDLLLFVLTALKEK